MTFTFAGEAGAGIETGAFGDYAGNPVTGLPKIPN